MARQMRRMLPYQNCFPGYARVVSSPDHASLATQGNSLATIEVFW